MDRKIFLRHWNFSNLQKKERTPHYNLWNRILAFSNIMWLPDFISIFFESNTWFIECDKTCCGFTNNCDCGISKWVYVFKKTYHGHRLGCGMDEWMRVDRRRNLNVIKFLNQIVFRKNSRVWNLKIYV